MIRVLPAILLLCGGCSFVGVQGSGTLKTETRPAEGFTAVEIHGSGHLILERTGTESLAVTTDDNLMPLIETKVENGTLKLTIAKNTSISPTKLEYRVTVKDVQHLGITGAGNIDATKLEGDKLSASISGAGDIKLAGKVDELE